MLYYRYSLTYLGQGTPNNSSRPNCITCSHILISNTMHIHLHSTSMTVCIDMFDLMLVQRNASRRIFCMFLCLNITDTPQLCYRLCTTFHSGSILRCIRICCQRLEWAKSDFSWCISCTKSLIHINYIQESLMNTANMFHPLNKDPSCTHTYYPSR